MRLNRYLARAGVASRRKSDDLILAGSVRVNGKVVNRPGSGVYPGRDRVQVDGREVLYPKVTVTLCDDSNPLTVEQAKRQPVKRSRPERLKRLCG